MSARVKVGGILTELRKKTGCSIAQVASGAGMSAPALSYYEKDEKDPSLEYAIKLADYYGVTLDELCGRKTEKGNTPTRIHSFVSLRRNLTDQELTFTSGVANWKICDAAFVKFMEQCDQLISLVDAGALDQSVMDIWLEKQLSDATSTER